MKSAATIKHFITVLCLCLLSGIALADSLQLKDGRLIQGKYLGGTSAEINFLVNGEVQRYPVANVLLLNFGGASSAAPAPEPRTFNTAPAPAGRTPAPALQQRRSIASERAPADTVTVPSGQRLVVRMIDAVDSDRNQAGDRFQATLEEPLMVNDQVIAPRGTDVSGRLVSAEEGGRIAGKSELRLELVSMRLSGQEYALSTGEYELSGKSRGASTAKKVGGGAVVGAIIGGIAGGGKGAAIGAGVGAGAGTAVQVMTRGEQVRVPSETVLEFTLRQPLTLPLSMPSPGR